MKQTALLSGYVFQWNMKKGGWAVYVFSILAGVISAIYRAYAGTAGETSPYRAKGFLPYELIIDQSLIPLFFGIGLLALLLLQFLQLRKYQKEGKGIYTFLTLPMKGTQVANAFLIQSLAMVLWSESQEMLYATVRTNADCSGSIGLYCLGPRQEESLQDENGTTHPVKKEPVATLAEIPVSENRWVLGLEDVGEGLLVFIGEPDGVTAELYGYDGTLLDSNTMPSEEPVHEIEIQQTKWENGRGVFVEGSQKTGENEYYVHFFTGYWIENGTIKPVYLNGNYGTWTAVGKEKVLVMDRTVDKWNGKAEPIHGNTMNGFKISIYDITEDSAGKEVYRGELETDIDEDALEFFNYFNTRASKEIVEHQTLKSTRNNRQLEVLSVTESAGDSA